MMAVAMTLLELGIRDRSLFLFDTFEGMTLPTEKDVDIHGNQASSYFDEHAQAGAAGGAESSLLVPSSLEEVQAAIASTGYPMDRVFLIRGRVEETIPASAPDSIALLRLDTDWYESTLHELSCLYPRIPSGGVLIIDDYGHWTGAREAVDEYFSDPSSSGRIVFFNRIDYSGRLVIVP